MSIEVLSNRLYPIYPSQPSQLFQRNSSSIQNNKFTKNMSLGHFTNQIPNSEGFSNDNISSSHMTEVDNLIEVDDNVEAVFAYDRSFIYGTRCIRVGTTDKVNPLARSRHGIPGL